MRTGRYHALVGRSYDYNGACDEWLDLERHYHMLVAAMSGGGKSTLMRMALSSLALNTAPNLLQIILVDLKNDDLVPFRNLPHVINYAGDIESAAAAIEYVYQIKTERIASQDKPFRLLLVIDELAELGSDKDVLKPLGAFYRPAVHSASTYGRGRNIHPLNRLALCLLLCWWLGLANNRSTLDAAAGFNEALTTTEKHRQMTWREQARGDAASQKVDAQLRVLDAKRVDQLAQQRAGLLVDLERQKQAPAPRWTNDDGGEYRSCD
jgi:hypothetical protein